MYELCIGASLEQSHNELNQFTEDGQTVVEQRETLRYSLGTLRSLVAEDLLDMKFKFGELLSDNYTTTLPSGHRVEYMRNKPYRMVGVRTGLMVKEGLITNTDDPTQTYFATVSTQGSS
eukprot:gb/GECG01013226.1/.p1 GENE.gb/GECG01013226.1/~~gb/GECG01013226.1/.p1  ORF type:complete len:119 (+),score=12.99 gb/GECG01013226.1/:1-357(+)